MTKGFNLPDNVSPSDPDAPWNQATDIVIDPDFDPDTDFDFDSDTCIVCGSEEVVTWVGDESFCQDCYEDEVKQGNLNPDPDLLQIRDL